MIRVIKKQDIYTNLPKGNKKKSIKFIGYGLELFENLFDFFFLSNYQH